MKNWPMNYANEVKVRWKKVDSLSFLEVPVWSQPYMNETSRQEEGCSVFQLELNLSVL